MISFISILVCKLFPLLLFCFDSRYLFRNQNRSAKKCFSFFPRYLYLDETKPRRKEKNTHVPKHREALKNCKRCRFIQSKHTTRVARVYFFFFFLLRCCLPSLPHFHVQHFYFNAKLCAPVTAACQLVANKSNERASEQESG